MASSSRPAPKRNKAVDLWPDDLPFYSKREADDAPSQPEPKRARSTTTVLQSRTRIQPIPRNTQHPSSSGEDSDLDEDGVEGARKRRQNPTCVTPFIANLAKGYFKDLVVAGPPLRTNIDEISAVGQFHGNERYKDFLQGLLDRFHAPLPSIVYEDIAIRRGQRSSSTALYNTVRLDNHFGTETFSVRTL